MLIIGDGRGEPAPTLVGFRLIAYKQFTHLF